MSERFFQTYVRCPLRSHGQARLLWDKARQEYVCPTCEVRWTAEELDPGLPLGVHRAEQPPEGGARR